MFWYPDLINKEAVKNFLRLNRSQILSLDK